MIVEVPRDHYCTELFGVYGEEAAAKSSIPRERLRVLHNIAFNVLQAQTGDFFECGVYRGGSSLMFSRLIQACKGERDIKLHLFDTWEGIPYIDHIRDNVHVKGDFHDVYYEDVTNLVPPSDIVKFHKGYIPHTFAGFESHSISFAHIDVDVYRSVKDCCEFIYPRMQSGGAMVFDDYAIPSCKGATIAVDEFFASKLEDIVMAETNLGVVFKI